MIFSLGLSLLEAFLSCSAFVKEGRCRCRIGLVSGYILCGLHIKKFVLDEAARWRQVLEFTSHDSNKFGFNDRIDVNVYKLPFLAAWCKIVAFY